MKTQLQLNYLMKTGWFFFVLFVCAGWTTAPPTDHHLKRFCRNYTFLKLEPALSELKVDLDSLQQACGDAPHLPPFNFLLLLLLFPRTSG